MKGLSSSAGTAMLIRSLLMKSRKGFARDIFDIYATDGGLVYDVINTDCWAQHGSAQGRCFCSCVRVCVSVCVCVCVCVCVS